MDSDYLDKLVDVSKTRAPSSSPTSAPPANEREQWRATAARMGFRLADDFEATDEVRIYLGALVGPRAERAGAIGWLAMHGILEDLSPAELEAAPKTSTELGMPALQTIDPKAPPAHQIVENGVLGRMIIQPDTIAATSQALNQHDFSSAERQRLFVKLCDLHGRGESITPVVIEAEFHATGMGSLVARDLVQTALLQAAPADALPRYFEILKNYAARRASFIAGRDLMASALAGSPIDVATGKARAVLDRIGEEAGSGRPRRRLLTEDIGDIEEEEIEWLWPGRIPLGEVTVIMGKMGDGKSTLSGYLAMKVSTGTPWSDCPDDNEAGTVLILQAEEDSKRSIKPRMAAFGYGKGKVHLIKGTDQGDGEDSWFSLASDVDLLAKECETRGDVRLILIDPIGAYLRGINGWNEIETRAYLQPLFRLARDHDVAVVLLAHPKKDGECDILDRMSGTGAILQMARVGWYFSEDPGDKSRRLLSLMKGFDGTTRTAIAVAYDARKRVMTWFDDAIPMSARQVDHLLQKNAREAKLNAKPGRDPAIARKAEEFLLAAIAAGPMLLSAVQDQALNHGIKEGSFRMCWKRLTSEDGRVRRYRSEEDGRYWLALSAPKAESPEKPEEPGQPPGPPDSDNCGGAHNSPDD